MILDQLIHADQYRCLGERFAAGFEYLRSTNFAAVPDGRYPIRGDDVFAMVQSYETKPAAQGKWEAHRIYADIQYMIASSERMGVVPIARTKVEVDYDADKDVGFFTTDAGQFVLVDQGSFAIFLPHDVHMPMIAALQPARIRKVVVKVRL